MRVLMTGMSPPQCGRKTQTGYEHVSDLWGKALRAGGAQVEHRTVTVDEPLSEYDVCLVGLIPPNSIANRYLYTALSTIGRARMSGCALVLYVDDWRFGQITHGVRVVARDITKRLLNNSMFVNLVGRDWALTDRGQQTVTSVLNALDSRPWPTTLVPAFTWGDHDKLPSLPAIKTEVIDPTAFSRRYEIPQASDDQRDRTWIMGTFSDQRTWIDSLGLEWDVSYVGTRRSRSENGHLQEADLVASYGQAWGTLAAPYGHAGSGWWRNRFVYSASAGAVMLASPQEVAGLGPDYYRPGPEVEKMSDAELREFADTQRRLMAQRMQPAQSVVDQVMSVMKAAREAMIPVAAS